jgi:hypothetical protein
LSNSNYENSIYEGVKNTKMTAFWDISPNSVVEPNRRFGDAYCLHDQEATGYTAQNPILSAMII